MSVSAVRGGRPRPAPGWRGGVLLRRGGGLLALRARAAFRATHLRREGGLAFDRQVAAEVFEALVADAFDLHQVRGLGELSVLVPVVDDPLRDLGADAREQ